MVYVTHADIEKILGLTLSGSTKPFTDTAVDDISAFVERYARGHVIAKTKGRSLAEIGDADGRKGLLEAMIIKAMTLLQAARAGVSSQSSSDGTSQTFIIDWGELSQELDALAGMAAAAGKILRTTKSVDTTEYRRV